MKRIRLNEKALGKWEIACILDEIEPLYHATIIFEHLYYKEMVQMLHRAMTSKLPDKINEIEWQNYI